MKKHICYYCKVEFKCRLSRNSVRLLNSCNDITLITLKDEKGYNNSMCLFFCSLKCSGKYYDTVYGKTKKLINNTDNVPEKEEYYINSSDDDINLSGDDDNDNESYYYPTKDDNFYAF